MESMDATKAPLYIKVKRSFITILSDPRHHQAMLDNAEMARRVRFALDNAGRGTQAAIAREGGITPQAVTGWRSSGTVDKAHIAVLAKYTKRKVAYFLDPLVSDDDSSSGEEESDWANVLGYSQVAGLGTTGPEAQEWANTHKLKFRRDSLAKKRLNPENLAVMYGEGDSMEPLIERGDAILFDRSDTQPKNRGVYVLLVPGVGAEEYVVKRAMVSRGETYFVADNPEGDHDWKSPRAFNPEIKVIGRVRWIGGWVP